MLLFSYCCWHPRSQYCDWKSLLSRCHCFCYCLLTSLLLLVFQTFCPCCWRHPCCYCLPAVVDVPAVGDVTTVVNIHSFRVVSTCSWIPFVGVPWCFSCLFYCCQPNRCIRPCFELCGWTFGQLALATLLQYKTVHCTLYSSQTGSVRELNVFFLGGGRGGGRLPCAHRSLKTSQLGTHGVHLTGFPS